MRDYSQTWTDYQGRVWPVVQSISRLKYKYPAHAALRTHVFHRDDYKCLRCQAEAIDVPFTYTGRDTLWTNMFLRTGGRSMLVLDHVLTLKAGGRSVIENLQTLCDDCNRRKLKEDLVAIRIARAAA